MGKGNRDRESFEGATNRIPGTVDYIYRKITRGALRA
jgi:hypothetical protein